MRFLKALAILMVVLVLAAVGVVVYFFSTSVVEVTSVSSIGVQATERAEQFGAIKQSVVDGSFQGVMFSKETIGEASDYALITYTVRLKNQCLVPIDMIEVQIVPVAGDVLQVGDLTAKALQANAQGNVQTTMLTGKTSNAIRDIIVTYYVWGAPFEIKTTSGN